MPNQEPVWITGIGVLTSLGTSFTEVSDALIAGRSGVRHVTGFDVSQHPCRVAGQVLDIPHPRGFSSDEFNRLLPLQQCALWCCADSLVDADLFDDRRDLRIGIVLGIGAEWSQTWDNDNRRGGERAFRPELDRDSVLSNTAELLGVHGPQICLSAACASGNHAISQAREWLRMGLVDVCLAGACDMGVTPFSLASFGNLRALSRSNDDPQKAMRPFDRARDGMVLGDGGAVFVLEAESRARRRRAEAYAEVAGFGATSDAYHMVIPCPEPTQGIVALRRALADAKVTPEQVEYVNAHATGTPVGDVGEAKILQTVFGPASESIPVSSTKSMTGHLLSAASAVEAAACVTAIRRGIIPPTINLDDIDPNCKLCHVPNEAREAGVRVAVSNSFGFGGNNTSLVLKSV